VGNRPVVLPGGGLRRGGRPRPDLAPSTAGVACART